MNEEKSRDLTIFEYFEQLQLEYIVAELRKKIYPSLKDKNYYRRVMQQKEAKIQDIALRNSLPSIFSEGNGKYKREKYQEIYYERGLPNFLYRDEIMRDKFEESDINNYYYEGSEVKVFIPKDKEEEEEIVIGSISSVNLDAKLVEVKFETSSGPKYKNFSMENVTRIL